MYQIGNNPKPLHPNRKLKLKSKPGFEKDVEIERFLANAEKFLKDNPEYKPQDSFITEGEKKARKKEKERKEKIKERKERSLLRDIRF
tara:strand:- start:98 stop:361 length:264 start_codon:yes stop_codon:yes gene_type:complete